jgi:hypothetical protein
MRTAMIASIMIVVAVIAVGIGVYAYGYRPSPNTVIIQGELIGYISDIPISMTLIGTNGTIYSVPLEKIGGNATYSITVPNYDVYEVKIIWSRSGLVNSGIIEVSIQKGWMISNIIEKDFNAPPVPLG